ncbi:iron complex outermembrane recepter protein [Beijerinckia sp. 28-YEA-48]|nr:iron complex outermembrane recepter protein [Beijerinckia sp. 28-YEA-48]
MGTVRARYRVLFYSSVSAALILPSASSQSVAQDASQAAGASHLPAVVVEKPSQRVRARPAASGRTSATTPRNTAARRPVVIPPRETSQPNPATAVVNRNSTMVLSPSYAGGQVATGGQLGMLGNRSVMDTPFSQTSYTQKVIQDQQARKLEDVFANDSSIRTNVPRAYGFDFAFMRGFDVPSSAYGVNGLYGIGSAFSSASLIGIERVEVLRGPAALMNGMAVAGGPGGSINLVTKRAADEPLTQITNTYASRSQFGTHLDIGRRYGPEKEFGVRFNGAYRGGGTEITQQSQEVGSATLGLDYRGQKVRLSADFGYENNDIDVMQRFVILGPTLTAVPAPPSAGKNFNPTWGYWRNQGAFGLLQGELDVTDNLTAYVQAGIVHGTTKYLYSDVNLTSLNGAYNGNPRLNRQEHQRQAIQAGLRWTFDTGPIHHQVNFNVSQSSNEVGILNTTGVAFRSNIYNPVPTAVPNIWVGPPPRTSDQFLSSIGVANTMSVLGDRLQLTAGLRKQYVKSNSYSAATGSQTAAVDDSALSPAFGLVLKPLQNVSLYANYVQGLEPGSVVGTQYRNAGAVLPPYRSKQVEAGIKVDWGRVITSVSAFEINRPLSVVDGANFLTQDGESRVRGIELNAFGSITDSIRVLGGATFLDAKQEKTQGGSNDGKRTFSVPKVQVNLGAEWDTSFLPGLTLTGRMIHTGNFYADAPNALLVPDWTRFDVGARYTFTTPWNNKPAVLRLSVENVFNKNYWQGASTNRYLYLGAPRTFLVSTTFNF